MRYTALGRRTGLRVSEIGLGTANFGTAWGGGTDLDGARAVLAGFLDAGGTFVDTGDCYNFGEAETILGRLVGADRERIVLSSKYTCSASPVPQVWQTGNGRRAMVRSVEESLRRLRTDRLDLYWCHFPDPLTPTEEIVSGLDDLVRSGKVLHVGLSNFPAWRVARAATLAELRGLAPIVGISAEYSLVERTAERELLPMAEALGVGVVPWSPLGGGVLTGKYRTGTEGRLTDWKRAVRVESGPRQTAVLDAVLAIADEVGAGPQQVAMAWLRHRAARSATAVVPVIGPRDTVQLKDYLGALDVDLDDAHADRLDAAGAPDLGVPHEFGPNISVSVLGESAESVVRPRIPVA